MRNCAQCGVEFEPRSDDQRFCRKNHGVSYRRAQRRAESEADGAQTAKVKTPPVSKQMECVWCRTVFVALDEEQRYCKTSHARKAHKRRKYLREIIEDPHACPRPDKIAHWSYEKAEARLARLNRPDLEVYECRCGKYHLGHTREDPKERDAA